MAWTAERLHAERTARLRELVGTAVQRSPWHRDRLGDVEEATLDADDLRQLPVMTKDDLMGNFDAIVTDPGVRLADVNAHIAKLDGDAYFRDELHAVASGGSSGMRGVFVWGWDAWATVQLTAMRRTLLDRIGDPQLASQPPVVMIVAAENATHFTSARQAQALPRAVAGATQLPTSVLLGHLQQLLGGDHRRDRRMIGLHVLAPELHDPFVVLATDDVAALTDDPLRHADILADVVVQLCGRLVVRSAGAELAGQLPGAQGRIAFAWLVDNRDRATRREDLATAIWGEARPAASGQAMRALLSKLRSIVGRDSLPPDGPLRLRLDRDANVDVEVAARAIHDAESGVARQQWERAWIASQIAMNVTRRSFLTGHDGAWVEQRRRELGAVYVRALATLAAAAMGLGETELLTAERAARELVAAEPLSEGATALLMRALDARGERPAALVAYDDLRLRLREALGVAPGPRLLALHSQLLMR